MQVYFKNNFVSIYYNKESRLGKAVWNGHLEGAELREAFLLCLELIDRFMLTRWLADDRLMKSIEPADLEWSKQNYIPRIGNSSLLRFARLPSQFQKNLEAVNAMIEQSHTLKTKVVPLDFTDEQEAMDWLMEPLEV
ncbi:hypothetical protein [Pontibacter vulgaris]|uniref:hypothetical protein n=1 Tax=Pontibacter vulgaris TaxID=2905679 RepID=UPI001FA6E7AE|nr:hypothetical protein [Pontibacter vulgaris]